MAFIQVDRTYYGQVMAIFLLACKEMVTRMKEQLVLMLLLQFYIEQ